MMMMMMMMEEEKNGELSMVPVLTKYLYALKVLAKLFE